MSHFLALGGQSIGASISASVLLVIDWFDLLAVQGTLRSRLHHPQLESNNFSVLSLLYGPALTSLHDWL